MTTKISVRQVRVTFVVFVPERDEVHEFVDEGEAREFARLVAPGERPVIRVIHYGPPGTTEAIDVGVAP